MDDFGLGAALLGGFRSVLMALRRTGRTTRLLERYQCGDRIIFTNENHARNAIAVARSMGKEIDYSICDPAKAMSVFDLPRPTPKGRLHLDHVWVEEFYESRVEQAMQDVRHIQDQGSGYGEPHRKTREAVEAISRFQV